MSRPARNPFVFGGPVDATSFIGRQREVNLVFEQVTSRTRGCVAVIGERRIGKTSLLHYVAAPDVMRRWNLDDQTSVFLFIDCGAISPLTVTRFWQDVLRRFQRELERRRRHERLVARVAALLAQPDIRTADVEFLLEDIRDEGLFLVILLDEFEWTVRTDPESENVTRELLGGLRALINHVSRALSLIVATRRQLDEVCRDVRFMGSPFYNNFVYLHLRPFNADEADSLLDQMLRDTGVAFSAQQRAFVFELAGTHPLLLQAAAACVFDAVRDAAPAALDRRLVLERFMDLTEHHWKDFWRWSSAAEQDALVRMARHARDGAKLLEQRPEIGRSLAKRGLLGGDAGKYRLFSPMLRHWLLERVAEKPERGPADRSAPSSRRRPMVFVSYSHKDEAEKEALLTHLRVLQRGADMLEVWSDEEIGAGEAWEAAIEKAVSRSRVAILLVTANFLTSDFILRKEVPALLQRRERDGVRMVPVIAKPCAWKKIDWLAAMNVRPVNGRPVWAEKGHPDEALARIAEEVAAIVSEGEGAQT